MKKNRLLELAKHLREGKLGHKEFKYDVYNLGEPSRSVPGCGTSGCAIGECPIVWPELWEFNGFYGLPVTHMNHFECPSPRISSKDFFDLSDDEYDFVFIPDGMCELSRNPLDSTATRKTVAKHIEKFVEHGGIYV